jgi:hypothetical protein
MNSTVENPKEFFQILHQKNLMTIVTCIVIILFIYLDEIVLMARSPYDIDNKLKILNDFYSTIGMIVNTNKTNVMIVKLKKNTYDNFMYDNKN